jgi:hypothetical protein
MISKKDEIITRVTDVQLNEIEKLIRIIDVPASKS